MISFIIPGDPKAQERPRFFRHRKFVGAYDPIESATFKQKVAFFARQAGVTASSNAVAIKIKFFFRRPKCLMRKRDSEAAIVCMKRPDIDNLIKAAADGLNGIAYHDDGQIWAIEAEKWYHEKSGVQRTEIEIL